MNKVVNLGEALKHVHSGQTLMAGDFLGTGTPDTLIGAILDKGVDNITLISCTTGMPDKGVGRWIVAKRVKKVITSHIGTNPETGRQMSSGELEIEFSPQGTLAERIRCGGFGLGGALTPAGLGTDIEAGKQKITIAGKEYLLETALCADVALVKCQRADTSGNLVYHRSGINYNPLCAMAAKVVIAEAEDIVPVGMIDPNEVDTPGALITCVVRSSEGGACNG